MAFTNGYSFMRLITFDHTKVSGSADLSSFPALISGTYPSLATLANGGLVTNSSGFDIRFEGADGTKLDWEMESYTATTGAIIGWVRIPTLYGNTAGHGDLTICMYYGNSAITTNVEQNKTGVWDSSYKAVYHFGDSSSLVLTDSTTNANTLTNNNTVTAVAGPTTAAPSQLRGGAAYVAGSSQYLSRTSPTGIGWTQAVAFTIELWFKGTGTGRFAYVSTWDFPSTGGVALESNTTGGAGILNLLIGNAASSQWRWAYGSTNVCDGNWHRVGMSYTGTSAASGISFYVDGVAESNTVNSNTDPGVGSQPFIRLASLSNGFTDYVTGSQDEVRLTSGLARSADWHKTAYNSESAPSTFYTIGKQQSHGETFNNYQFVRVADGMSTGERIR